MPAIVWSHGGWLLTEERSALQRFFHDLATPLSAVGLHLERAIRQADRGEDPSEALRVTRGELEKAFALFERERDTLLKADQKESKREP